MTAVDLIKKNWALSDMVFNKMIGDFSDKELLVRTSPAANHTAWQIGHLICSENSLVNAVKPGCMPALPEGFAEKYAKGTEKNDNSADFLSKDRYIELWKEQRAAATKLLDQVGEAGLDQPAPESMRSWCPTFGDLFLLLGNHPLMHSGQVTAVRRQLGKPIVM